MRRSTYTALIVMCALLLGIGVHNVDNSANLLRVNADVSVLGVSYTEVTLFGVSVDAITGYTTGLLLILTSGIMLTYFALLGGTYTWQK